MYLVASKLVAAKSLKLEWIFMLGGVNSTRLVVTNNGEKTLAVGCTRTIAKDRWCRA